MHQLTLALGLVFLLTGCTTLVNSVTSKPIQPDPSDPSVGTDFNDIQMDTYIGVNLKKAHPDLKRSHINVNVYNALVLLTGEVPNIEMKALAGDTARAFHGVRQVHNELQVRGKTSIVSRTNDALITGKIKAGLVFEKQIKATDISVTTEDSVVYLMGTVLRANGEIASNIASASGGVRKVVKVFEYVD